MTSRAKNLVSSDAHGWFRNLYVRYGIDWWDETTGVLGKYVGCERHDGEGVCSVYARAWYLDYIER